jgi:hypothetical protein
MRSPQQCIDDLARLSRDDRAWILSRLSPSARAALLGQAREATAAKPAAAPRGAPDLNDERTLNELDAGFVAGILAHEASWVIAMIMSLRTWAWESQVLSKVPAVTRLEVTQLRVTLPQVSAAMRNLLIRTLRELLLASRGAVPSFDLLVDRMRMQADGP